MGDLTQDVRDAAGALGALVPHAVSFGQPVVDSIKAACEAVEPTLTKDEVVIAVVGEAAAKRTLLRNVLGADAITGPKARKDRTIRIRARGAYDYTAKKNDGHVIRFARNVPDRNPLYRKSIRVSIGSSLCLPFARLAGWPDDLRVLRESGHVILALTPRARAIDITEFGTTRPVPERVALVIGAEGTGLSAAALDAADYEVKIAMAPGADSVNVATACGIALHRLAPSP